jgi:histone H3/H4
LPTPVDPLRVLIRKMMKTASCQIITIDALDLIIAYTEGRVNDITKMAVKLANHTKRTKTGRDDLVLAFKMKINAPPIT